MHSLIRWAPLAFVRLVVALAAGILTYLYGGEKLPELWPWLLGGFFLIVFGQWWAAKCGSAGANDAIGLLALAVVFLAGLTSAQLATESRRLDHLSQLTSPVEFYRAVVDENPVVRPATYATTLRVSAVRVGGRWQPAVGGIRVSVPREDGVAAPLYGEVWLVRGQPAPAKAPLNPGEFDYRRYLAYHQIYHQQFIHPDQYRILAFLPPSYVRAVSLRAARVLDGVFRRYVTAKREYAMASALVLGLRDDIDQETKQAYANTGTTHIMAVSGLQVGLLFGLITWALRRLFGAAPGFRYWSAGVGLAVIWSYAFVTGCSASVLRAAVMFSFIIVARVTERQSTMYNTLAVAAFVLLCYDPYLLADVGFQLSFLAVLSIVYLQPRIAGWVDFREIAARRQRPWQSRPVRHLWKASGWAAEWVWQATALTLAAQVATFPLGLYYFHQFPLSFLLSNLVAVPLSSGALYVGLGLLAVTGITHVIGALVPAFASGLDVVPRLVAVVLENIIWAFNEYIFWIGRQMPQALISGIQLSAPQTWLVFGVILLLLIFLTAKRLAWLGLACALLGVFAGSRAWAAHRISTDEELIVYSIPRRSVCGFWQGAAADIVTVDSLPLSETERTYRIVPGSIQRAARRVSYYQGWQAAPVPARLQAEDGLVLVVWRGLRLAFVTGYLSPARQPWPVDVVVLRRNARVRPAELAAVFGKKPPIVFDSSCRSWYVARQDSLLRAAGFHTHDVTAQGAFRQRPRQ
ncbi:ComEC/Rec2-related protein [Hymenobacter roseosalivarius DSM 11622]|uniref:ComEC/Rec2-related protein n=1 Tax=Hymenobacter roseosalivarius DSM 11622 TaxID=645990 RepID=A0A1W1VEE9_9BACT|nr:ComEC/Rec2 family competence protein [Hymenobacter roseosalivarius]SMB91324.1 ComEC/Rec2-related protein [Hymenobacter roseosalivarius DSM 11622]